MHAQCTALTSSQVIQFFSIAHLVALVVTPTCTVSMCHYSVVVGMHAVSYCFVVRGMYICDTDSEC
jgi:hypothetical protein